jgi:hypothetical protein
MPQSLNQSWTWCEKWLPEGKKFHTIGMWRQNYKKKTISVVCYACALMCSWAGLYSAEDKETLLAGVNTMMQIARKLLNKRSEQSMARTLEEGSDDHQETWSGSTVTFCWCGIWSSLSSLIAASFVFCFFLYFCYQLSRLAAKTVMVVAWSNFTLAVKRILHWTLD